LAGLRAGANRAVEEWIVGLVRFISERESSKAVRSALLDLQAQADAA
jgi:hypothetical protein